jgi:transcriptional regulator with XRE-family HTH domain
MSSDTADDTPVTPQHLARMQKFGDLLRDARERKDLTQQQVADALGVTRSAVNQWESGETRPKGQRLADLARILSLDGDAVLGISNVRNQTDPRASQDMQARTVKRIDPAISVPQAHGMPRDLPVRGKVSGGPGGFRMGNGDVVTDWVRRPPRITGRPDVFALYVGDGTMSPRHESGALIIVETARPPSVGDDVVIELKPKHARDEPQAMLRRLVAPITDTIQLRQFSPPADISFPLDRVAFVLRVMTMGDLFGN